MALPNTGITTSMVGAAIGSSSRDVGTLCDHPNVNKWSINKPMLNSPIPRDPLEPESLKQFEFSHAYLANRIIRDEYHYWYLHYIRAEDWSKPNSDTWSNAGRLYPELPVYRLGDFRGYDHSAKKPRIVSRRAEINIGSNGQAYSTEFIVNTEGISNLRPILNEIGPNGKIFKFEESGESWALNGQSYVKTVPTTGAIFIGDDRNTIDALNPDLLIDIPHTLTFFNGADWSYVDFEDIPTDTSSGFNTENKDYPIIINADMPSQSNYYRLSRPVIKNSSGSEVHVSNFIVHSASFSYSQDINYPDPADDKHALYVYLNYTLASSFYSAGVPSAGQIAQCNISILLYSVNQDGSLSSVIEGFTFPRPVFLEVGNDKELYLGTFYSDEERTLSSAIIQGGLSENFIEEWMSGNPNYAFKIILTPTNFFTP